MTITPGQMPVNGNSSGQGTIVITPGATNLSNRVRLIYIGGVSGVIVYEFDGQNYATGNLWAGQYHPITADKVLTGATINGIAYTTTATGLTGVI